MKNTYRSIGRKLASAMALCLVTTLSVGGLLSFEIARLAGFTEEFFESEYRVAAALREIETHLVEINRDMLVTLVDRSSEAHEAFLASATTNEERVLEKLEMIAQRMPEFSGEIEELRGAIEAWRPLWLGVFQMAGKGGHDFAYEAFREHGPPQLAQIRDALEQTRLRADESTLAFVKRADDTKRNAFLEAGLIVACAFALTLGSGILLARSIVGRIVALNGAVDQLSCGDREFNVPHREDHDELGDIARGIDRFREELRVQEMDLAKSEAERSAAEARTHAMLDELQSADDRRTEVLDKLRDEQNQRKRMLHELHDTVGAVVASVKDGSLDKRISNQFQDAEINALGQGVNEICEVIGAFLENLQDTCHDLAAGDLGARMPDDLPQRYGMVAQRMNASFAELGKLVDTARAAAGALGAPVTELRAQSSALSAHSERQATLVSETAKTMDTISVSINSNAGATDLVADSARKARSCVDRGEEVIAHAVGTMDRIRESSEKISKIIDKINSIAFQTNILALNASVESARAGAAGKGFSVVAQEVRALSQKTSEAAKEIQQLVSESASHVQNGVLSVNDAGQAFGETMIAVGEVARQIDEIAQSTKEQSNGVGGLNTAFQELDRGSQETAKIAERASLVAHTLDTEAAGLDTLMRSFRTTELPAERHRA